MKALKISIAVVTLMLFFAFGKRTASYETNVKNFATPVFSETAPFKKGEEVSYLIHYGILDAGIATLSVKQQDTAIDGKSVYHMVGDGKTLSIFEWFYKVRDVYETYLDEDTYVPRKFRRRVNEGGYIINRDYHFVPEEKQVITKKKGAIKTPKDVQDMLSSFYYLRTLDFDNAKPGSIYKINAFVDYEMWPFYVKFVGRDEVKIESGKYKCLKFVPVVMEGRVFKSEEDLEIWVSDDANKIPILAKANIIVGSIKGELIDHSNLQEPLVKVKETKKGWWF